MRAEPRAVVVVVCALLFSCLSCVLLPLAAYAAPSIRVLLVDIKEPKLPQKDEEVQKIGTSQGEVVLNGIKYTGKIEVWKGTGGMYIINEIPFEEYIKGVVAAEVGGKWDMEALKAQAVVARTYALYQKLNNNGANHFYDLTSSVLHQAYRGSGVSEAIVKAVEETAGQVLTYEGKPIIAFYHSTSGGVTEDAAEVFGKSYPYLKPVETSCELSPFYVWEKRFAAADIEKAINATGLKDIIIVSYTESHRIKDLRFITEEGELTMLGKDFRKSLGWDKLPSTLITSLTKNGGQFVFEGKGYGHGVGMCQWSALEMAQSGKDYEQILCAFYPGTKLEEYAP